MPHPSVLESANISHEVYGDEAQYSSQHDKFLGLQLSCPLFRPKGLAGEVTVLCCFCCCCFMVARGVSSWSKYFLFFIMNAAISCGTVPRVQQFCPVTQKYFLYNLSPGNSASGAPPGGLVVEPGLFWPPSTDLGALEEIRFR